MSQLNSASLRKPISKLGLNETITLNGVNRSEVTNVLEALSQKSPAYQFEVTRKNGNFIVKRVVPTNLYGRAKYIETISKSTLKQSLKQNKNVKTRTGEALGISARTIGRLIQRYGL